MPDERPTREPGQITARERAELKALIKLHFRTLRQEVDAEEARLLAEVATRMTERSRAAKAESDALHKEIDKLTENANAKLAALIEKYADLFQVDGRWGRPSTFHTPRAYYRGEDQHRVREAMVREIRSRSKQARLRVVRDEVERLREIHVDALQSRAALEIVGGLPDLGDLMTVDLVAIGSA